MIKYFWDYTNGYLYTKQYENNNNTKPALQCLVIVRTDHKGGDDGRKMFHQKGEDGKNF